MKALALVVTTSADVSNYIVDSPAVLARGKCKFRDLPLQRDFLLALLISGIAYLDDYGCAGGKGSSHHLLTLRKELTEGCLPLLSVDQCKLRLKHVRMRRFNSNHKDLRRIAAVAPATKEDSGLNDSCACPI